MNPTGQPEPSSASSSPPREGGTIRLFRFRGIQVYLHFSWFIVAAYMFTQRVGAYHAPVWAGFEYLALFAIVLLHEFGHSFACRQTGGTADQIVLWPFGGIAFGNPPRRAGAVLWTVAAGPLVNVALLPILEILPWLLLQQSWIAQHPDVYFFADNMRYINRLLLVFNLLPVFPLDGGQILRALLWFPLGEIRSLQIASVIGIIGGGCLAIYALMGWSIWLGLIAFFLLSQAIAAWQYARAMVAAKKVRAAESPPIFPRV